MAEVQMARVLIVDDEPQLRELLVDALSDSHLEISTASSGQEALDVATQIHPDLVITDLCLGDLNGMDVIDRLRQRTPNLAAVFITGQGDPATLSEASRRQPIEMLNKPLDIPRLQRTVQSELTRQASVHRLQNRTQRLRHVARKINDERKSLHHKLHTECAQLTTAYRTLSTQLSLQRLVLGYQKDLLTVKSDDDVFKHLFGMFVQHSGPLFGTAMVCDSNAELQMVGRFGVPSPDNQTFCRAIAKNIVDRVLGNPRCMIVDATDEAHEFDESIRRYLCGVSILAIPLIPSDGQMIGVVILYRKGEQPFHDSDLSLAEMIARTTAISVQSNE